MQTIVKQKIALLELVFLQWLSIKLISGVYTLQIQLQPPPTSPYYLQPGPASHNHLQSAPSTPTSPIRVSMFYRTTSNQPQLDPTSPDKLQSPSSTPRYHPISCNQLRSVPTSPTSLNHSQYFLLFSFSLKKTFLLPHDPPRCLEEMNVVIGISILLIQQWDKHLLSH